MSGTIKKPIVVAVSGGFDPLHPGHVRLFKQAKALGDKLVVILNNDNWLRNKKGFCFMSEMERKEVIESIKYVDKVVLTRHKLHAKDMSVSHILEEIKPDIFANGGDRNKKDAANPKSSLFTDLKTCKKLGTKLVYNLGEGGKIQSSSSLVENVMRKATTKISVAIKKKK